MLDECLNKLTECFILGFLKKCERSKTCFFPLIYLNDKTNWKEVLKEIMQKKNNRI